MTKYYSIDELFEFARELDPKSDLSTISRELAEIDLPRPNKKGQQASFRSIKAGCEWVAREYRERDQHGYNNWLTILRVLAVCEDGENLAHDFSRDHPGYSTQETADKFEEARDNMAPPTCAYVAAGLDAPECSHCPASVSIKSPMAFSYQPEGLAELQSQFVLEVRTGRFFDIQTGEFYDEKAFNNRFNHKTTGNAANAMKNSRSTGKVEREVWTPGDPRPLIRGENGWILNSWIEDGISPETGDWSLIEKLLGYLVPDDEMKAHFLTALAFHIQHPSKKIRSMFLLQGRQGTGKSSLVDTIELMVGRSNFVEIGPSRITSQWTADRGNKQVIFIDELMPKNKLEQYEYLKRWIAEDEEQVEQKHMPVFMAKTPRLTLAATNHRQTLALPPDDRRINLCTYWGPKPDQAFFNEFWAHHQEQTMAFKDWLLSRDVSAFNPAAPAIMTSDKAEAIEDSKTPIQQALEELVDGGLYPFDRDLVPQSEILNALRTTMGTQPSSSAVRGTMRELGFQSAGQPNTVRCGGARVWSVRNHDHWAVASAEAKRAHIDQ